MPRQKISPFLWFDTQAEEAANFYVSLFPDSQIDRVVPGPGGEAMFVEFRLSGAGFIALNGGPHFQFNEAISLSVDCNDQAEVDRLWESLAAGGAAGPCGWLKDRYGLSWQIVPSCISEMLASPDAAKSTRMMDALRQMTKLDIAALTAAYEQSAADDTADS